MTDQEIVVECFRLAERVRPNRVPSVAGVSRLARELGASFDNMLARKWLAPFIVKAKSQRAGSELIEHKQRDRSALTRAPQKVSLVPSLFTNPSGSVPEPSAAVLDPPAREKRQRKARDAPDRSWVEPLKATIRALEERTLASLTVEERFALARYHAMRFGNCSAREGPNRARASPIAAGITNLAAHRDHGRLRVWEYIAAEREVWEARGKVPHFKPWDITTFLLEAVS